MPNKAKIKIFFELVGNFVRNSSYSVSKFIKRLVISFKLMPRWERFLATVLLLVAILIGGNLIYKSYLNRTTSVPEIGGEYKEAVVGEVKTLNPVIVQTDAEKSISSLIFPGLISISPSGEIEPDIAERWEISGDEKSYTFYLRKGVVFHDGEPVKPADVAFTIETILSPEIKSPLAGNWQGVTVSSDTEDNSVTFTLPGSYGPFIYNCNFGIIPAHIDTVTFSKRFIGAGRYKFTKGVQTANAINEIQLDAEPTYFGPAPYIRKLIFEIYPTKDKALSNFKKEKATLAIFGTESDTGVDMSYDSQKEVMLFVNTRKELLASKENREKIFGQTNFDQTVSLTITAQDTDVQKRVVAQIVNNLSEKNISVQARYLSPQDYQSALNSKDFELLLYGCEKDSDRDPYPFWHSSQKDAKNFSGYGDKATDILIEDARMLLDKTARNAKYDQFFNQIGAENLYQVFDPVKFQFYTKSELKGVSTVMGAEPGSRFENIDLWYLKEKRIKK